MGDIHKALKRLHAMAFENQKTSKYSTHCSKCGLGTYPTVEMPVCRGCREIHKTLSSKEW